MTPYRERREAGYYDANATSKTAMTKHVIVTGHADAQSMKTRTRRSTRKAK